MPIELLRLTEQLADLQTLYTSAVNSHEYSKADIGKKRKQLLEIQEKIIQRKILLDGQ